MLCYARCQNIHSHFECASTFTKRLKSPSRSRKQIENPMNGIMTLNLIFILKINSWPAAGADEYFLVLLCYFGFSGVVSICLEIWGALTKKENRFYVKSSIYQLKGASPHAVDSLFETGNRRHTEPEKAKHIHPKSNTSLPLLTRSHKISLTSCFGERQNL